jgi:glycosyltransferase involved in cell wall biosynthesis
MNPTRNQPVRPRVAVLNNEIFPYRIQLFRELGGSPLIRLLVLYSAAYGSGRKWKVRPEILDYPNRILPGFSLRLPKKDYSEKRNIYINPTLFLELMRFHPDVVIGYEYSIPAMTALLYAWLFHRPYILWTDCTPHTERHLARGQRWARSFFIPRAKVCIGTNRTSCQQLIVAGAAPHVILEAPQMHEARIFAAKVEAVKSPARSPDLRLLFVGALTERKGVELLLRAFRPVAEDHPGIRLRIVGDGPLRPRLEQVVAEMGLRERVEFAGFVNYEDIHNEYAKADAFVLPTLEDAFGVVVVEALAAGVPVICSPFAGAADYIQDGETGFIINPNDTGVLTERIGRLLSDPALRERFSARGKDLSLLFDASSVAQVFLKGIRMALEGPPG